MTNHVLSLLGTLLCAALLLPLEATPETLSARGDQPRAASGAVCSLNGQRQVLWLGGRLTGLLASHSNALHVLDLGGSNAADQVAKWTQPHLNQKDPFAARSFAAGASLDGKLYVFGGRTGMFSHSNELFVLDEQTLEISEVKPDTGSGAWPVPAPREGHSAAFWGASLVVFGGKTSDSTCMADLAIFDTVSGQWRVTPLDAKTAPRYSHKSVVHNDKLYVFGGKCGTTFAPGLTIIDLVTFTVEQEEQEALKRTQHTATAVGSSVYIVGGYDTTQSATPNVVVFDLDDRNCLAKVLGMSISHYGHCAVHRPEPHSRLLVIGGATSSGKEGGPILEVNVESAASECLPTGRLKESSLTLAQKVERLEAAFKVLHDFCEVALPSIPEGELPSVTHEEVEGAQALLDMNKNLPNLASRVDALRQEAVALQSSYLNEHDPYHLQQRDISQKYSEVMEWYEGYADRKRSEEQLKAKMDRAQRKLTAATATLQGYEKVQYPSATEVLDKAKEAFAQAKAEVQQAEQAVATLTDLDDEYHRLTKEQERAARRLEELKAQMASELQRRKTLVNISVHAEALLLVEKGIPDSTGRAQSCEDCGKNVTTIAMLEEELIKTGRCITQSDEAIARLEEEMATEGKLIPGNARDVTDELNAASQALQSAYSKLQSAESAQYAAQDELDLLNTRITEQRGVVAQLHADLDELSAQRGKGGTELELWKQVDELYTRIKGLTCKWNSIAALRRALEVKLAELDKLEAEIDTYRAKLQARRACQSELAESWSRIAYLEQQLREKEVDEEKLLRQIADLTDVDLKSRDKDCPRPLPLPCNICP